ncbi:MAG UNVERIFIED_CONTAM: hypothetical protein LVR18_19710 [Planctomycetaceae bacterium]
MAEAPVSASGWTSPPALPVIAQEPLRQLINRELAAPAGLQIPASTDAEFLAVPRWI